jgi:hypothetical protein
VRAFVFAGFVKGSLRSGASALNTPTLGASPVRMGRTIARRIEHRAAEPQSSERKTEDRFGASRQFVRTGRTIAPGEPATFVGMSVRTDWMTDLGVQARSVRMGRTIAVGTPATFVRTGRTIARRIEHKDTETQRSDRKREDRFRASRLLVRSGGTIARGMKHKGTKAQRSDRNSNGRKGHPIPILSSFAAASSSPSSFSFSSSDLRVFVPLCSTPRAHVAPVRMNARAARNFSSSSSASDLRGSAALCSILRAHAVPVRTEHGRTEHRRTELRRTERRRTAPTKEAM